MASIDNDSSNYHRKLDIDQLPKQSTELVHALNHFTLEARCGVFTLEESLWPSDSKEPYTWLAELLGCKAVPLEVGSGYATSVHFRRSYLETGPMKVKSSLLGCTAGIFWGCDSFFHTASLRKSKEIFLIFIIRNNNIFLNICLVVFSSGSSNYVSDCVAPC